MALVGASLAASAAPPAPVPSARYKVLAKVIDRNVGHAHMTRGVNVCTVLALRDAVTAQDFEVLGSLLQSDDSIHRLAAGYVLSAMGPAGLAIVRSRGVRLGNAVVEDLASNAGNTELTLARYRAEGRCRPPARHRGAEHAGRFAPDRRA
jgi:hypothetical protein